jgi:hypothetical protein
VTGTAASDVSPFSRFPTAIISLTDLTPYCTSCSDLHGASVSFVVVLTRNDFNLAMLDAGFLSPIFFQDLLVAPTDWPKTT